MPSDNLQHPLYIPQHLVVPKTQNRKSVTMQHSISLDIFFFLLCMLTTIDLNHNLLLKTDEIYNVITDRLLSSELMTIQLFCSQMIP